MTNGLRIRLARHGLTNRPLYHIVAIHAGKTREARPLEKLGEYDPIPKIRDTSYIPMCNRVFGKEYKEPPKEKSVSWDVGRIKYWLSQGAEPTGTVVALLRKAGLLEPGATDIRRSSFAKGETSASPFTRVEQRRQAKAARVAKTVADAAALHQAKQKATANGRLDVEVLKSEMAKTGQKLKVDRRESKVEVQEGAKGENEESGNDSRSESRPRTQD